MATADKLERLKATKADLKAALTEQGQTPGDVFETYPDLVRAIQTGVTLPTLTNPGAAADLRQGKQLIDQSGAVVDGTLVEVEQATPSISVSSAGLITATAGDKSATKQLSSSDDADFVASNIKSGVSIFGVTGTASGGYKVKDIYNVIVFSEATLSNGTLTLKLELPGNIIPKSLVIEKMWFGASSATTNSGKGKFRFSGGVRFDLSEANVVMMISTSGTGVESNDFTVSWSHNGTYLTMIITDAADTTLSEIPSNSSEMTRFQGELFYKE